MKRYFYLLEFSYSADEENVSYFNLGVFSKKAKVFLKIEQSLTQKGFCDYTRDNYKISKFAVDLDEKTDKSKAQLYCVSHEYEMNGSYYWNMFGYFSRFKRAKKYVDYLKLHSRIGKKYPDNFEINQIRVDNYNCWSEGFDKFI